MTSGTITGDDMSRRGPVPDRVITRLLWLIVAAQLVMALGFVFQVGIVTALWPFPGRTPLSNTFIGSIFLAAAASTGWCLLVRSERALTGVALDYLAILVPFTVVAALATIDGGGPGPAAFGVATAAGIVVGVLLLRWARAHPWRSAAPTPSAVVVAFAIFVVALVLVGTLLVIRVPRTMPWFVTPQLSTLYGFMFLGAAAYFAYGLVERRWENAGGQLAGFLAYDIVLLIPLTQELLMPGSGGYSDGGTAGPPLNLALYVAVVAGSGLLAGWYLLVRTDTSIWTALRHRHGNGAP